MKVSKILLINDDLDDSIKIRQRLAQDLKVVMISQAQARLTENFDYDLIVIDNDANDLKAAKGPATMAHVKKINKSVEILYTSFQPGWVEGVVCKTKKVRVVKTDDLLSVMEKGLGIKVIPRSKELAVNPQISLMVTYNPVEGYSEGVYSDGKLIILSFSKRAEEMAREVLQKKLAEIYEKFEWKADRDMIKNIFVYDGVNGGEWPARMAAALGHDIRMKVQMLACGCDWGRKVANANTYYVDLHQVSCGGSKELGAIADVILGVKRPNFDYSEIVPVPLRVIQQGAEKYEI